MDGVGFKKEYFDTGFAPMRRIADSPFQGRYVQSRTCAATAPKMKTMEQLR